MSSSAVANRFLLSNLAVIGCCCCYVLWWILAFNPVRPVGGLRSGWLLVPAFVAGLVGIVLAIWAGTHAGAARRLFVPWRLVVAGIVAYVVLLLVTRLILDRQVTAELALMVGWAVLTLYQVNALYAAGVFARHTADTFVAATIAVLIVCLVCYTLYYRLGPLSGFVVGIVPLGLGGVMAAVLWLSIFGVARR